MYLIEEMDQRRGRGGYQASRDESDKKESTPAKWGASDLEGCPRIKRHVDQGGVTVLFVVPRSRKNASERSLFYMGAMHNPTCYLVTVP